MPIAHITARCCLLSWIHLQQVDTADEEKDVERDLSHPTCRNISIYLLRLPCQGKRHRGWKHYNDFRPALPETSHATAVPHNDPFKSGAELDRHLGLDPFDGLVQTAQCASNSKGSTSRVFLSRRNRDDEKEHYPLSHLRRHQCAPALPCSKSDGPSSHLSPSHNHARIIRLKVVSWLRSTCFL